MNAFRAFAVTALLVLGTALPAAATVTTVQGRATTGPVMYATVLTPDWHGVGQFEGSLSLTIGDDGIVSGTFRQADNARTSTVTGGLDGDRIWLDLGQGGLTHIDGTFDGRTIAGGTYLWGQNYSFKAIPQAS